MINKVWRGIMIVLHRRRFAKYDNTLRFHPENSFFSYDKIEIGRNVFINRNAYFIGKITIGNDVMFGPDVFINDGYHKYEEIGKKIRDQGGGDKIRVFIDDDAWIGAKVAIMKGVHIYEGCIIGTASVVTKDMPPYSICAGNPCKPIKYRYTDEELREHIRLLGRDSDDAQRIIELRRSLFNKNDSNTSGN